MSTRKTGYTLIEIIVVAALISLTLGSWFFVSMSSKKADKKLEQSQEYYRLLIMLQSTLKRDVRSALNIKVTENGNYLIDVIRSVSEDGPVISSIIYRKENQGKTIHRIEDNKTLIYDFSQFTHMKSFTFELIPPLNDRAIK